MTEHVLGNKHVEVMQDIFALDVMETIAKGLFDRQAGETIYAAIQSEYNKMIQETPCPPTLEEYLDD